MTARQKAILFYYSVSLRHPDSADRVGRYYYHDVGNNIMYIIPPTYIHMCDIIARELRKVYTHTNTA